MSGGHRLISRAVNVGALIVTLTMLLGAATAASAAAPTWLEGQRIEPGQSSINGLSCASATTCLAASGAPIVQDNGLSYEPANDPDPGSILNAVSCAPGTHFCMFVDNNGGAFAYNNGSFTSLQDIDGNNEIDSVSCPSSSFCMAIDHNDTIFKYAGGSWDGGTTLTPPSTLNFTNFVNVSCSSSTFCIALASTDGGEVYYQYNGSSWSSGSNPFDTNGAYAASLTCTSTTFCLETDEAGYASVFGGSGWSTPERVDSYNSTPQLFSSCSGTSCVAVDFYDNFYSSTDGTTWTSAVNIHASTGLAGVGALACASANLCVAGDGIGDATTYAIPPAPTKPTLTGTPKVGQHLTLTHSHVQTPSVWYYDDWRRCDNPDATCTLDPISTSLTGYTLAAADAHKYIDAREVIGFGFDEEGPIVSNIVGPISSLTTAGTVTFVSGGSTSKGVVTITLSCKGGPCKGKLKLVLKTTKLGSASYSIAAGKTAKVRIALNQAGKNQLRKHHGKLTVKLVITPSIGKSITVLVHLTVKQ